MKYLFALLALSLHAYKGEIASFEEIRDYLTPETVLFCDIDGTLIMPVTQLGSREWCLWQLGQISHEEHVRCWQEVQPHLLVVAVDPGAPALLHHIENKIYGLTAREPCEHAYTVQQLESAGYTAPEIIYCGAAKKSETLLRQFETLPSRIIFIDDRQRHVDELHDRLTEEGIEVYAFRYGGADAKEAAFNPLIAQLQHERLPEFLSDEEARFILSKTDLTDVLSSP